MIVIIFKILRYVIMKASNKVVVKKKDGPESEPATSTLKYDEKQAKNPKAQSLNRVSGASSSHSLVLKMVPGSSGSSAVTLQKKDKDIKKEADQASQSLTEELGQLKISS